MLETLLITAGLIFLYHIPYPPLHLRQRERRCFFTGQDILFKQFLKVLVRDFVNQIFI